MVAESIRPPVICLMGPTAAGKTGLAVELVQKFPVDIISVDSALVYRGMDIGTAKPDAATLSVAPHRLIDILEPTDSYSAANFRDDAQREIHQIQSQGRVPLLVGGTMLYYRALLHGLSELPEADPKVRADLEARAQEVGWAALHAELARLDPVIADKISPNDPQRIQRALEVIQISGRPLSELQTANRPAELPFRVLKLVVCPEPRSVLHQRIDQRFTQMMEDGFEREIRGLYGRDDLQPELPAMRAVGYRQAWAWLDGQYDRPEMREKVLAATRQLAKRQLTWLRKEPDALWYDPLADATPWGIASKVQGFLETT